MHYVQHNEGERRHQIAKSRVVIRSGKRASRVVVPFGGAAI